MTPDPFEILSLAEDASMCPAGVARNKDRTDNAE